MSFFEVGIYEGEGAGAGDGEPGAGDGAGAGAGAGTPPPKTFTKEEVDRIVGKERINLRKERDTLASQLEELKKNSKLSEDERTALESQIEELRTAHLTVEEQAKRSLDKATKEHSAKLETANSTAKDWETKFNRLQVGYDIGSSAVRHDVLPKAVLAVESLLRPNTRLVEIVDPESNKPTGVYASRVRLATTNSKGEPVTLDLTTDEAIKHMKELPEEYGYLFKNNAPGGLGGNSGHQGGKPLNIDNMTMDQYMEARRKNPASVGLSKK